MKKPKHVCPTCGAAMLFTLAAHGFGFTDEANGWINLLELQGRSYSYVMNLKQRVRDYLIPMFNNMDIREIRTYHVTTLYHDLLKSKKLSSKTIKHVLDTLKSFLKHAMGQEKIDRMPVFPRVNVQPLNKSWIDSSTQLDVINHIAPGRQLQYRVLMETGIRPGEACALQKRDLVDGGLRVERAVDEIGRLKSTKTGLIMTYPISDELRAMLNDHVKFIFRPDALMFTKDGHEPISRRFLYSVWKRACTKADVHISLYQAFRHSRVSQRRAELEASMRDELKQMLGHTHATTTMKHYALPGDRKVSR